MNRFRPLALLASSLLALSLAVPASADDAPAPAKAATDKPAAAPTLPLDELRDFVEAFDRIRNSYVDPVTDKALFESAIRGMLSSLDPHSAYLDAKEYDDLKTVTTGEFGGIGVEVSMEDGGLRVISPIDDTPASRAGVQAGDLIVRLDGKVVKGMTMNQALDAMRGKPGESLQLSIQRKDQDLIEMTLVRAKIELSSVRSRVLEPGYVVVRISQFQNHTGRDLLRELAKYRNDTANPLKGLILDLRNNPGGVLPGAIEVADAFLDKSLVVYTKGRDDSSIQRFEAVDGQAIPGVPLVVLVNAGSASASEIVAGALQDNHRALIAGTTTFGKGSVQTVLPVGDDKAIKLTTARYYTPSGRSIQAEGIRPDVVLEPATHQILTTTMYYKEADLQGHLANPDEKAATPATPPAKPDAKARKDKTPKGKSAKPTASDAADKTPAADATAAAKDADKPKPLAEEDYVMFGGLSLLKAAQFWQQPAKPVSAAAPATVPADAPH